MNKPFFKLIHALFRHPLLILILTGIIFLLSLLIIPSLHIDNSIDVFFNKKGTNYLDFENWKKQFGSDQVIVIALEAEDIFTAENLTLIESLSDEFEAMDGVDHVTSLSTVNTIIGRDQDFIVEHLIEEIPRDSHALAQLKKSATSDPLYAKNVISTDGRVAAILVELEKPEQKKADDQCAKRVILRIQNILKTQVPETVHCYISGLTAIEYFYAAYMQDDFKAFMPFLLLMIIGVMYFSFRSVKLTALPMAAIVISVAGSMALLHLLGFSVNNVTTIIPPILMAIMIADSVHVIGEAIQRKKDAGNQEGDAFLEQTVRHLMFPCFLTTATTACGFWSLSLSKIPPVRQLGIVVGCGVVIALVVTFTFLPALAKLWNAFDQKKHPEPKGRDKLKNLLLKISKINQRYYKVIVGISIIIVGVSIWGVTKIKAETSVIEYFRKSTDIYRSTLFIEEHLSGVHTLNISLRSDQSDFFKSPAALKRLDDIAQFLCRIPEVDKVTSVTEYLKEINKSFHNEDQQFYRLPDNRRMVSQYVLLYGREDLEDFMDDQWEWATIRVRLKEHSTIKLSGVMQAIRNYLKQYQDMAHIRVLGQTVLEVESNNTVADGQMKSLGLAMLVIFGMMFVVFRSFAVGLVSVVPNVLPILMNFGLMGFLGIRLDSATSMIAAVGIGIVVDDTIHFLHGYGEALQQTRDFSKAVEQTLQDKGAPIIFTSLILFFGFGILAVSKFMPTAYFGMLSALLMINALFADLFVLPSLLIWFKPPFKGINHDGHHK